MPEDAHHPRLIAAYASPENDHFTITKPIDTSAPAPALASPSPRQKTAYLVALRQAVAETQQQINKELTERMQQDKARGPSPGQAATLGADEDREEENYGEEVQEEE